MKRVFKSKRSTRLQLAAAATAALVSVMATEQAHADAPLFDSITEGLYTGFALPSDFGFYFSEPNLTSPFRPPDSYIAGTQFGDTFQVPTGTTTIGGVDLMFCNATNDSGLASAPYAVQYNNGNGVNFSDVHVTVNVYGTITPVSVISGQSATTTNNSNASNPIINNYTDHQSYTGLNASNPAFSNLLYSQTFDIGAVALGPYYYYIDGGGGPFAGGFDVGALDTIVPGLKFSTPLNVSAYSQLGISYNIQGSLDGGKTYQNYAGLSLVSGYDDPLYAGATALDGFYTNIGGETNGNFIDGPIAYQNTTVTSSNTTSGSVTTTTNNIDYTGFVPQQSVASRVYGVVNPITYNWAAIQDGSFNDQTQWNPNTGVPGGNDTAAFNLGATAATAYTVEMPDAETVLNFFVQNDNINFNMDAQNSYLLVQNSLTVGIPAAGGGVVHSSLTVENTTAVAVGELESNAVTIGNNTSTGVITVGSNIYFGVDYGTTINAGSKLLVQAFGKFDTDTLTIAGTTGAWTGQLDIGFDSTAIFDGNLATVTNQLKTGYNKGAWNGQGIISSAAASDTTHLTAVGAILNNDGHGNPIYSNTSSGALGVFDGENPPTSAVLLRYTYYGDANLDGTVDGSDYSLTDNGFLNHLSGWYNGDFNYDGVVNGSDYTLLDNAFNQQYGPVFIDLFDTNGANVESVDGHRSLTPEYGGGSDYQTTDIKVQAFNPDANADPTASVTAEIAAPAGGSSVPEPASLGLLGIAAVGMLGRRSRRTS